MLRRMLCKHDSIVEPVRDILQQYAKNLFPGTIQDWADLPHVKPAPQPGHPDRSGHHLRIVVALVRKMVASREYWREHMDAPELSSCATNDVALFWDFLSLPQLQRNTAEQTRFTAGLGFCNVLYGHASTAVWLQTPNERCSKRFIKQNNTYMKRGRSPSRLPCWN